MPDGHRWSRLWPAERFHRVEEGGNVCISGGVRSIWPRHDLETFKKRLRALEAKAGQKNVILTEDRLQALEKAKQEKESLGEIETEHPGYLGVQDTFYVGGPQRGGADLPATFIDTYCKVGFAKVYDRKNALLAADLLNDRVLTFYEGHGIGTTMS